VRGAAVFIVEGGRERLPRGYFLDEVSAANSGGDGLPLATRTRLGMLETYGRHGWNWLAVDENMVLVTVLHTLSAAIARLL